MSALKQINLSDDPLKNILLMAPHLDEAGQNRVLGVVFGLMAGKEESEEKKPKAREPGNQRERSEADEKHR